MMSNLHFHALFSRRLAWPVLFLLQALILSPVLAGSGNVWQFPQAGIKGRSGLRMRVDSRWVDGNGYRPVRVRLSLRSGGATPADRVVKVALQTRSWYRGDRTMTASAWVELSQGEMVGEAVIPIPQSAPWSSIDVETWEDGVIVKELSGQVQVTSAGAGNWSEAVPSILFIDSDVSELGGTGSGGPGVATLEVSEASTTVGESTRNPAMGDAQKLPDIRSLASHFFALERGLGFSVKDFDTNLFVSDEDLLKLVRRIGHLEMASPTGLPDHWIDYSSADMMFVSYADLQELVTQPACWEAIRRWIAAGGIFCVYDIGEDFSRLGVLEEVLELSPLVGRQESNHLAWNAPKVADYDDEIEAAINVAWGIRNVMANDPMMVDSPGGSAMDKEQRVVPTVPVNPCPFLWREAEFGHVVALAAENPFPGRAEDWAWLLNSLDARDWMWYRRHGMSQVCPNSDYWNWIVKGVGSAPVNSFLVLITLFVLAIGPVNYIVLRRFRRLPLLLLFVPLGAGMATTSLFLYALLDDGLGVRGRARTLTLLNQPTRRVVTWGRHTYYAGLVPSDGLRYSTDAVVYPLEAFPDHSGRHGVHRRIFWGQQQTLSSGYLSSRTLAQMMVVQSRKTDVMLEVQVPSEPSGPLRVTNHLGVDIQKLLLSDAQGRRFVVDSLARSDSTVSRAVQNSAVVGPWFELFSENKPTFPLGFNANEMARASGGFGSRYSSRYFDVDVGLPPPTSFDSALERGLLRWSRLGIEQLPPRTYLAIVNTSPDLAMGVDSTREESSFHVVYGRW